MIYQERELGKTKRKGVSFKNTAKIYPAEYEEDNLWRFSLFFVFLPNSEK